MKSAKRSLFWPALVTICTAAAASSSAVAYIDPGSGSYVFQLLVGALVGSAVAVKVFWRRVSAFFTGRLSRKR